MATKLRVLMSGTHDPWFNLATEEWIFRECDPSFQTLFLWRNAETVVIGRNQNPWSECKLTLMESDGVKLARRSSGGGAVFHDLGNTCFTFLSPSDAYDRAKNNAILLDALLEFGIRAESSGRNDLVVSRPDGPRKVSGSAFFESRDRAFHHGTLLLHSDLDRLADYLTPHPKKLASKGRGSVRSRVANLSDFAPRIDHEKLSSVLVRSFEENYAGSASMETLSESKLNADPALRKYVEKYSDWNWRFGETPRFEQEMTEYLSWGFVQIFLDSDKGRITRARIHSDALFPDLLEAFEKALVGRTFTGSGLAEAAKLTREKHPGLAAELAELTSWLKREVEIA